MSTPETTASPVDVSFKAAWDVWREDTRFGALPDDIRAAVRCGFIAGWSARDVTQRRAEALSELAASDGELL